MDAPFFFLHIPRTSGTTLNNVLESHFAPEEILSIYSRDEYETHSYESPEFFKRIKLITGHLLLETTAPPTIYGSPVRVITFLRDPIARLTSEYDFLRTWKSNHLYTLLNENKISFQEYVGSREKLLFYRGKNFMTRCVSGMPFQDEPRPEKALEQAKRNLEEHFTFVGLQERFFESLVMLGDIMGIDNILHERRNALKQEAKTAFTEEDLALAREYNQADIELYAFASELFAKRVDALGPAFAKRVENLTFINKKFQRVSDLLRQQAEVDATEGIDLSKDTRW